MIGVCTILSVAHGVQQRWMLFWIEEHLIWIWPRTTQTDAIQIQAYYCLNVQRQTGFSQVYFVGAEECVLYSVWIRCFLWISCFKASGEIDRSPSQSSQTMSEKNTLLISAAVSIPLALYPLFLSKSHYQTYLFPINTLLSLRARERTPLTKTTENKERVERFAYKSTIEILDCKYESVKITKVMKGAESKKPTKPKSHEL